MPTSVTARRVHQYPTVRQYMTPMPCTIGPDRSLAAARKVMMDRGVRHLPVVEEGKIVGILSERDVFLVESIPEVNSNDTRVQEAMVAIPYVVPPDASVAEVVERMVQLKIGSAVVAEESRVVGVFTTIDALRALSDLLVA